METLLINFLKYCIVGFSGVIIDFALTYLCKEKIGINKYIASMIGFSCACTSNYIINRIWTFRNDNPEILKQYFFFILTSLIGLALNIFILYILQNLNIRYYLSKIYCIIIVCIWNFIANSTFTFR